MTLTSRERIRRAFFHEEMDRPAFNVRTLFPEDDPSHDELRRFVRAHDDRMERGLNTNLLETEAPIERMEDRDAQGRLRRRLRLRTPAGDLTAEDVVNIPGEPALTTVPFLKNRADVESYLSLPMPELDGDVEPFFEADRRLGDRGMVEARLGSNPAGFAAELCGSETFALLSVTDRDVLHALCERRQKILLDRIRFLHARGVGPIFSMLGEEMVAPPLHGPEDFRDFNVRYDRPIHDLVHEGGGRLHIHCHGDLELILADVVAQGTDVLHPFEGAPTSRLTPGQAKAMARGRMTLHGNLQIADFYERTPDQIRAQTEALIRDVFDDRRGLIVCPTASPYIRGRGDVFLERYRAMVDAVREGSGT